MADYTPEQLADYFKQANAQEAFNSARKSSERYRQILEAQGINAEPEDPRPGLIPRVLEAMLTPQQMVQGAVAKLVGTPGYSDVGFLDAARKGDKENLSTGEMLRRNNIWTEDTLGNAVARAGVGFIGDVALDPLTYLTLGAGTGAKIGGRQVSKEALQTAEGVAKTPSDIRAQLIQNFTEANTEGVRKQLLGLPSKSSVYEPAWESLIDNPSAKEAFNAGTISASVKAEKDASNLFQKAGALLDSRKRFSQIDSLLEDPKAQELLVAKGMIDPEQIGTNLVRNVLEPQEQALKQKMGLAPDVPLEKLFEPPRLRLVSPISRNSVDIPVVSNWSATAFKALDGALYNTRVKLAKESLKGSLIGKTSDSVKNVASLFSTRLAAGSKVGKELIEEAPTAKYYAMVETQDEIVPQLSKFYELGGKDEDLEQFMRAYQAPLRPGGEVKTLMTRNGQTVRRPEMLIDQELEKAAQGYIARHVSSLEERVPGLGAEAARTFDAFKSHMDALGYELRDTGLIKDFYPKYLPGLYNVTDGFDANEVISGVSKQLADLPDSSFAKTMRTLAEAEQKGLQPNFKLKDVWLNRVLSQKRFMAAQEFYERTALELGLPKELGNYVKALAGVEADGIGSQAALALKQFDASPNLGLAEKMFDPGQATLGIKSFRDSNGNVLTAQRYQGLIRQAEIPGIDGDAARLNAAKLGLHVPNAAPLGYQLIDPAAQAQQAAIFDGVTESYNNWRNLTLGRLGELPTTRAGAEYVSSAVHKAIGKNLPAEDLDFLKGELPLNFVSALESSLDNRSLYQKVAAKYKDDPGNPLGKLATKLVYGYSGAVKYLKKWALEWWPAYHAQNISSIPFMASPEMNSLMVSMSPERVMRTAELIRGNGSIVQKGTGITYNAKTLERMALANGLTRKVNSSYDLLDAHADVAAMHMSPMKFKSYIKEHGFGKWAKDMPGGFANVTESFGREHLFYYLVEEGWDPKTAAARTSELFTNYVTGKTGFEKTVLNNLLFFYSFAKAQTANTLVNLVTKPGAITQQLHAIDAVKELLVDPTKLPPPPDVVEQAQTVRTRESISRFLGYSDSGNPVLLNNVQVPLTAMSGLFSLETPKDMSVGSLMDAAWKSGGRTKDLWLSSLTPPLKHAVQMMTGKNFFFDRPINDRTLRRMSEIAPLIPDWLQNATSHVLPGDLYKGLDSALKTVLSGRDNGDGTYTVSPARLAIVAQIPGMERSVMTLNAMQNPSTEKKQKLMRLLTGTRTLEVDPDKAIVFNEARRLRELAEEEGAVTSKKRLMQLKAMQAARTQ